MMSQAATGLSPMIWWIVYGAKSKLGLHAKCLTSPITSEPNTSILCTAGAPVMHLGKAMPEASCTMGNGALSVPGVTTGNLDRESAVLLLDPFMCLTVKEYSISPAAHLLNLPAAHPPK